MKNKMGFTLLELIIAISIMVFIAAFTGVMIQRGLQSRVKVQKQVELQSSVRDALSLISRDIEMAFHYRDINVELYNMAQEDRKKAANKSTPPTTPPNPNQPPTPTPPPPPPPPTDPNAVDPYALKQVKVVTRLYGEADKIDFTSLNNFRSSKNQKTSDQAEVGYYLETCQNRGSKEKTSSECLWRRSSPYIDADVKEGGKAVVLLENVKSLKFRYLASGTDDNLWQENWNTETGTEVMKDQFPLAIELTLVKNDTRFTPPKEISMTMVAPLRFPNNKPTKTSAPAGGG